MMNKQDKVSYYSLLGEEPNKDEAIKIHISDQMQDNGINYTTKYICDGNKWTMDTICSTITLSDIVFLKKMMNNNITVTVETKHRRRSHKRI